MTDEKLERWVEKKLEAGIDRDRIKKSLEEMGHDPSIVDSVENPFDGGEKQPENVFEASEDTGATGEEKKPSVKDDGEEDEKPDQEDRNAEDEGKKMELPNPKVSLPGLDRRAVIGIAGILIAGMLVFGAAESDVQLGEDFTGCMNQGVEIQSVSVESGKTRAQVRVVRNKSRVVLNVEGDGEVIDSSYSTFKGTRNMTVDAVGDKVTFQPVGCEKYFDSKSY